MRAALLQPPIPSQRFQGLRSQSLRSQIEQKLPFAFTVYPRHDRGNIPTGIAPIDQVVQGIPLHALTEICGSNMASSGKTSVLTSLLAQASRHHFCALRSEEHTSELQSLRH